MTTVAQITPSVDDIGALISTRTIDSGGTERGTFTDDTRPTVDQVENLIDAAVSEVLLSLDITEIADDQVDAVRFVSALRAAALVEGSYYTQSSEGTGSWRATLEAMFAAGVQSLTVAGPRGVKIF